MNDIINPSEVRIVNSPNCLAWPITTSITKLELADDGVDPTFDKENSWPEVLPPGWQGPLTFTLWLFMKINNQWVGSGIIQYWRGLAKNGGPVYKNDQIARNWVYDSRWAPMTGHQPTMGETIGMMVSAGNARNQDNHAVAERSQIVTFPFPDSAHIFDFTSEPPIPIPIPSNQLDRMEAKIDELLRIARLHQ